jgi:hypothetical protein
LLPRIVSIEIGFVHVSIMLVFSSCHASSQEVSTTFHRDRKWSTL